MTSVQDEVSIVVKFVRLRAANYLVKPLRMNELVIFMNSCGGEDEWYCSALPCSFVT